MEKDLIVNMHKGCCFIILIYGNKPDPENVFVFVESTDKRKRLV
jgi:hypothetical protein